MKDLTGSAYQDEFGAIQQMPTKAVSTGWKSIDSCIRDEAGGKGLAPGHMAIVAANPGYGKSIMATNMAYHALQHGPVAYCSLEMSVNQMMSRFMAIASGYPVAKLERGTFSPKTYEMAREKVAGLPPLYCPEKVSTTYEDTVDFIRECHDLGCSWFVLDYVQLCAIGGSEQVTRAVEMVIQDLRAFCVNEGVTGVILSQWNRQTSSDYDTPVPRAQGLWGSMTLEASADCILAIPHARFERSDDHMIARTYIECLKNRHGPSGISVPIEMDFGTLRVREVDLAEEPFDWPK
tara:strand:- start:12869 stop:13744 length:876 start_codon:yes stop_codon:yes gene_type:complete